MKYDFRLVPGPDTVALAQLAEELGFHRVWCPDIPAFGHDVWMTLARVVEQTSRIGVGAAVLIPSYRHPVAQASAIATMEQLAPGRLAVGFGTGFTGRGGLGQAPLTIDYMMEYLTQLHGLLRGETIEIEGALVRMMPFDGVHPDYPIETPVLVASQGPRGRKMAQEMGDGLICSGAPAKGFADCYISLNGVVLEDNEDFGTERIRKAVAPLVAMAYHATYTQSPDKLSSLPGGEEWLASVLTVSEKERHLSVHKGHTYEVSSEHDELIDFSLAEHVTFSGKRVDLRTRLDELEAAGATGVILGTSGTDVEREMRAFAEVAGLR